MFAFLSGAPQGVNVKASLVYGIVIGAVLSSAAAQSRVLDVPWDSDLIGKAEKSMKAGDVIRFRDPDGSIAISCEMTPIYHAVDEHPTPTTVAALETEAETGSPCEKHSVGYYYGEGVGVAKDRAKSNRWFARAAQQGYVSSFIAIGKIYQFGWGVSKKPLKAKYWYQKAAEHGNFQGEENLGFLYRDGDGDDFPADRREAMRWMSKAAEHGDTHAQVAVAAFLTDGGVFPRDPAKALQWLTRAYENGDKDAANNIAVIYHNGLLGKSDYAMARVWYERGAERNDAMSFMGLWKLYRAGLGVQEDDSKAMGYLRRAADLRLPYAYQAMAECYDRGNGVPRNPQIALEWYEKAADAGVPGDALIVGQRFAHPESEGHLYGVKPDIPTALRWYLKGVEQTKDPTAAEEAGDVYLYDDPKDLQAAFKMHSIAAESGIARSQDILANMYMDGTGVTQSDEMSLKWRQRAADRGYDDAQYQLAKLFRRGGHGVARDKVEAFNWMLAAALQGEVRAAKELSTMYKSGEGVEADDAKAFRWKEMSERNTADIPALVSKIYGSVGTQPTKSPEMARFLKWLMIRQKRDQVGPKNF